MKIMILAPYIYDKDMPEFSINKTGFGIMVNDIVKSIAEIEEVELVTRVITDARRKHDGKYKLISHTWKQVIMSANIGDWAMSIKVFFATKGTLKDKLRKMFYCLDRGYVRKCIMTSNPDVVHIHGIGSITKSYIEICEELQQKYMVTLHGLIGLNESVKVSEDERNIEKNFLRYADEKNIPVSVISSGMKNRIEKNYLMHTADNITVITNGTHIPDIHKIDDKDDIRRKYNLSDTCKICVVIGSIMERKNQIQIVEAFAQLDEDIRENCAVFMCGRDMLEGAVEKRISELGCEKRIFTLGFVSHKEIEKILQVADLNIVASLDEGFGLSIIEAYAYGVPTVTFSDLDAITDLYEANAMILVEKRNTESLAEGMKTALEKKWNKEEIRNYSRNFSIENMAALYLESYKEKLIGGGYAEKNELGDFLWCCKKLNKQILFCVGNISENKNQIALIEALYENKNNDLIAIIFGGENDNGIVRNQIIEYQLENQVVLMGYCEGINDYWQYADLNVLFSINDGFGLSIIEGYMNGVPSIAFTDLDAIEDVNAAEAMIEIPERNLNTVVKFLNRALSREWNKLEIEEFGKRFSIETMAKQYVDIYKKI
ncbi:glycosyltransferase [Blautia sp. AM22-22LB]|uniref:glycosyltransferase family 4 protein n=1 Tax=Blautia wexlerae TaxID=418240 RepID=UPI000E4CF8F7|nr:glycosyltransferase family 4 protein [Blautia wexlerae]MCC2178183.1 glycosyltransferase family 4 protein [Blautia wexlerae]RHO04062.1 glycosyltransferase [Blautia sp. AM22-22LB]